MIDAETVAARWAAWVRRFWWLRGAAAAFALISLLTLLLPLSEWEALRLIRAAVRSWREIAATVGALIGRLPGLPELDAEVVTFAVLYLSAGAPGVLIMIAGLPGDVERRERTGRFTSGDALAVAGFTLFPLISLAAASIADEQGQEALAAIFLILLGVTTLTGFLFACLFIPGFWRGAVSIPVFLATLDILAVLRAPVIGEAVNAWACGVLDIAPADCAA